MVDFCFKEMRTRCQSEISSYCFCVWCESRELGGRVSSRYPCVTRLVKTFSPDRVALRTLSNIHDGTPLRKQPTALTGWLFPQKRFTLDFWPDFKYGSDRRWCKYGVWVDCKCMEFVASGWFTRKWLSDLGIPLAVIRLGVTWLRKDQGRSVSPTYFWGKSREGAVWFSVYGASLDDWFNGGYVDVLFTYGEFGFSSLGSWSYSNEQVWNLGTRSMLHCFMEVKCQQRDTLGI